ncbi:DUF7289 family protein [Halobaculum sp. EA56]|uniref:DUF7289 family protein n=1 Tax=Halobaculum sp. EA56 TaxID=3421648 RepID=UPI003EC0650B
MSTWGGRDRRAQGDVIALVLLVAVTVAGATTVVALGGEAITGIQDAATTGAAEQSMTQFDSKTSLVAHGESAVQRVTLAGSADATRSVDPDAGWMNVTVRNTTDGTVRTVLTNTTLGAVVYREGDTTVAYQGGGVWRRTDNGSTMVSPPEFHYRETTLTLPLVTVSGDARLDGEVVIRRNGTSTAVFPDASAGRSNPLTRGRVVVTVRSRYYEAWGRFFEQRTGGNVTVDHAAGTATIVLQTPVETQTVTGAVVSGSGTGSITIQNGAYIDSYNSSNGTYASTGGLETTVVASDGVKLENDADLDGDIESGADVKLEDDARVRGNVSYTGSLTIEGSATVDGWTAANASVDDLDPVDGLIDQRREEFADSNDNDQTTAIDDSTDTLNDCGSGCTLTAGRYYVHGFTLQNSERLEIDTSGGPVEVVVLGDITLQDGAVVNVTGGGVARFYLEEKVTIQDQANVTVTDQRAPGLWLYMNPSKQAKVQGESTFVGVIYGPGGDGGSGVDITIQNQAEVYGGVVGAVNTIQNGIELHFDRALLNERAIPGGAALPRITYLHVSVTEIEVSED